MKGETNKMEDVRKKYGSWYLNHAIRLAKSTESIEKPLSTLENIISAGDFAIVVTNFVPAIACIVSYKVSQYEKAREEKSHGDAKKV